MKNILPPVCLVLFVSLAVLSAQSPDSYVLKSYAVGAATPISSFTFTAAATVCNLAPPTSSSTVNPTTAWWDDPVNTGRSCRWIDDGTGPLFALPIGFSYEATLTAVNAAGQSGESARANFSRLGTAGTPANLRLTRPGG